MEIDLDEEEALLQLSPEELQSYYNMLYWFITHPKDKEALADTYFNCIDLSDQIPHLNNYVDGQLEKLKAIMDLITQALPTIEDEKLREILQDNFDKIKAFFNRVGYAEPSTYEYSKEDAKKLAHSMAKELTDGTWQREGLSDKWKDLSDSVRNHYDSPYKPSEYREDFTKMLTEGLQRLREREVDRQRWLSNKKVELSENPKEVKLRKIAEQICSEGI